MTILELVKKYRIVTALRGVPSEKAADVAEALYCGGIRLLEITFDQSSSVKIENTTDAIRKVKARMGDRLSVGAGTVLTVEEAEAAAAAGAEFLLSPNMNETVIRRGKEMGLGMIPGAFTPTEIVDAYTFGADLVKVFPAGNMGASYLKALKSPLSHIPILAMGGVNKENLNQYLAISEGVGIGANIINLELVQENRFDELTELAKQYTELLK